MPTSQPRRCWSKRTPIRSDGGHLRGVESAVTAELLEAIGSAQQKEAGIGSNGIAVPLRATQGPTSIAHVLPLAHGDIRTRLVPQALAAVFVNSDGPASFENLDGIARAFEFTPAETRLASELLHGRPIGEAAVGTRSQRKHGKDAFAECLLQGRCFPPGRSGSPPPAAHSAGAQGG